jgi:hypothetical protein
MLGWECNCVCMREFQLKVGLRTLELHMQGRPVLYISSMLFQPKLTIFVFIQSFEETTERGL